MEGTDNSCETRFAPGFGASAIKISRRFKFCSGGSLAVQLCDVVFGSGTKKDVR